jgi:hypothetical protein
LWRVAPVAACTLIEHDRAGVSAQVIVAPVLVARYQAFT